MLSFEGGVHQGELEKLIVYGLRAAEWLEKDSAPEQLEKDYKQAFSLIFQLADEHSDKCVTVDYLNDPSCQIDETCPRRAVETFATGPLLEADFDNLEYVIDPPEHRADRLKARLLALQSVNKDRSMQYKQHLQSYERRFNAWFLASPSDQPEL